MRRLLIGLLLALAAGSALANACGTGQVEAVGTKTEVNAFGERCLGFELPGDATEASYNVTALSVPYAVGRTLMPLMGETPVNTLNRSVTLESGHVENVEVDYHNQEVAYLDLTFTVSTRDGNFYRNGQQILTKSGSDYGNLLWGVLWTTSFGLISLFWIPSTTETLHYTEIIPLDSSPIHYTFGGGGNCFSFSPNSAGFWIDPSRLQPGHVYPMYARMSCVLGAGIVSNFGLLASVPTVRWVRQGLPAHYVAAVFPDKAEELDLQGGDPTVAPGQLFGGYQQIYYNEYTLHSGGSLEARAHPYLPMPLKSYQVDRMWLLQKNDYGFTRFVTPFNRVILCMEWDEDNPAGNYCLTGSEVTYERVSANPPGPVTVDPYWGFPATHVGQSVSRGPNGKNVSKPHVQYSIPNRDITLTDTFRCVDNCDVVNR